MTKTCWCAGGMAIPSGTRRELEEYLRGWLEGLVRRKGAEYQRPASAGGGPGGGHKPFHGALMPRSVSRASNFERSLSSGLGSTYEHCAEALARDRFSEVERQHDLTGYVPSDSLAEIDGIIHGVSGGKRFTNYRHEVQRLVRLVRGDGSGRESRDVRSDLYLMDGEGRETYIEFKSPSPNKDQCLTTTRKHLTIHCIKKNAFPRVQTYFGMAYSPYGAGEYAYSIGCKYLDMKNHALVGKPLWDMLGGPGAYEGILGVYEAVGLAGGTESIRRALDA